MRLESAVGRAAVVRFVHSLGCLTRSALMLHTAVGHNHDHRLGASGGDQIVKNLSRAPRTQPRFLIASHSVQKIKDRVTSLAVLVACRSIDRHTSGMSGHRRVIPNLRHGSVRYILHLVVVSFTATDDEVIEYVGYVPLDISIVRGP